MAKFKQFLAKDTLITESINYFDDVEEITLDPDRTDLYDVVNLLAPFLVKYAYVGLQFKRHQHERRHGPRSDEEDAYNFDDFTRAGLKDELEDVITHLKKRLDDLTSKRLDEYIDATIHTFKEPLRDKELR